MNKNPLVSVVIPAHNEARWLPACLTSLRAQTYQPLELIVIDDGSNDETQKIAEKNGAHVIRHQTPRGEAESRNAGLHAATGTYIAQLDADAIYPKDFIDTAMRYFTHDQTIDGLIRGYLLIHPQRKGIIADYWSMKRKASYERKLRGEKTAEYGCQIGKKTAFQKMGGYDTTIPMGADVDLGRRMHQAGLKLMWAKELYFYHADPETLRHTLRRIYIQSRYGLPFNVRWNLWPKGISLFYFLFRTIFISLLPLYIILGTLHRPMRVIWYIIAIIAIILESVAPILFHKETREIARQTLRAKKYSLFFLLPIILFLQLRASSYGKCVAMLKHYNKAFYTTNY